MGLAFDLAEAINLLAGAALGETTTSLREQLTDAALRRSLAKALRKAVNTEQGLSKASCQELTKLVSSSQFIALICGDRLSDLERERAEAKFSDALAQLNQPIQAILLVHLRDVAVRAIESSLPLADRILHRSVRHLNEQVSDLSTTVSELADNSETVYREIQAQLYKRESMWVQPPLPSAQGRDQKTEGDQYVSALALAVADVLGQFPVDRIARGNMDAALIIDAYRAVDRLLSNFEEQSIVLLQLLDEADFAKHYYGSAGVGFKVISGANFRLVRISEQMRQIAKGMEHLPALNDDFRQRLEAVADLCLQVVEIEDLLSLRLLSGGHGETQYEDNLRAPAFFDTVGKGTVDDFSRNLIKLLQYRSSLHGAIANLLHSLPQDAS
jgi:hypothetical protein